MLSNVTWFVLTVTLLGFSLGICVALMIGRWSAFLAAIVTLGGVYAGHRFLKYKGVEG